MILRNGTAFFPWQDGTIPMISFAPNPGNYNGPGIYYTELGVPDNILPDAPRGSLLIKQDKMFLKTQVKGGWKEVQLEP